MSHSVRAVSSFAPSSLPESHLKTDSRQLLSPISSRRLDPQGGQLWAPSTMMSKIYKRLYTAARGNTKTPITFLPSSTDAISLNTVLSDCIDQLVILGHITSKNGVYQQAKSSMISSEGRFLVNKLCAIDYEGHRGKITPHTKTKRGMFPRIKKAAKNQFSERSRRDQMKRLIMLKSKESQLGKIEDDRSFLERHLKKLFEEMYQNNSFETIADLCKTEKQYKQDLEDAVNRLSLSDKRIKQLKPKLRDMKDSRKREIELRQDRIAELTDMIQTTKLKGILERKYVEKFSRNNVKQAVKKNQIEISAMEKEVEEKNVKKDSEVRSHLEIISYLERALSRLNDLKQYWTEKYYKDSEEKANQMEQLKTARSKDYERMQELTKLYVEYEQVCVDYRISNKKTGEDEKLEAKKLEAIVHLQCWWRGVMVRKGLGPFRKRKPKAAKRKGKGEDKKAAPKK